MPVATLQWIHPSTNVQSSLSRQPAISEDSRRTTRIPLVRLPLYGTASCGVEKREGGPNVEVPSMRDPL